MDFPVDRYRRSGATPREIADHYLAFQGMSEDAQHSLVQRLAGMADADVHELLARDRLKEGDGAAEVGPEPEPVLGVVSPPEGGDGESPAEGPETPPVIGGAAAPEPPAAA
ncbi:MAG TPA: hypothetical protein VG275_06985 [Solirubrobacteraceae bacterium]|jgi:hypothetical protein|nr:hypothetical protein [Solirubrobacteraceae bacterium]